MAISMDEKRDESVEELAEELESRLGHKEEPDELEEIELEDIQEDWLSEDEASESFWEDDPLEEKSESSPEKKTSEKRFRESRFGNKTAGKLLPGERSDSRQNHPRRDISEEEFPEDDWEEEDIAPMKPWMIAAAMAGIIALAAILCAVLWHFTHLERDDGDKDPQMVSSASAEDPATNIEGAGELSENVPSPGPVSDSEVTAHPESEVPTPASTASPSVASPTPIPASPSVTPSTPVPASPQTTAQPGTQTSTAVQEPISGTTAMEFTLSNEDVTPKDVINLRSEPSTLNADNIVAQAKNGEILSRTGVNEATGWTRVEYNGETLYAVTQYLTTDLTYKTPVQAADPNRVNTRDGRVILFTDCSDNITPKEYVNLRTEPSTSEGESTVRCQISNGEVVHRTGYSPDAGWSRVEYNGEVLYVVSSYIYTVE